MERVNQCQTLKGRCILANWASHFVGCYGPWTEIIMPSFAGEWVQDENVRLKETTGILLHTNTHVMHEIRDYYNGELMLSVNPMKKVASYL